MTETEKNETSGQEEAPSEPVISNTTYRQIVLALILAIPSIAPGMTFGYSAVSLDSIPANLSQESWFASLAWIATPVGCLASGPIMDNWGRRPALLLINIVGFCGWILLAYASTTLSLYTGRILTGASIGFASAPSSVYVAECIASNSLQLRGILLTWPTVALSTGILLVYIMGSLLRFTVVAGLGAIISVASFFCILFFIPESPAWLLLKGRREDAEVAQRRLGLGKPLSESRVESGEASTSTKLLPSQSELTWSTAWEELKKPEAYKPLTIVIFFFLFQQFSGVLVVINYLVEIVRISGFVLLNPYFVTVVAGFIILICACSVSFLLPKFGVKGLSTISGVGIAISWLIIGLYIFIRRTWLVELQYSLFNLIPLCGIILNVVSSSIGFYPLPFAILGEIFPPKIKGVASGIATCVAYLFSFIAVKTFIYLQLHFYSAVIFFYAVMAAFGVIHVNLFLPETTGKSLQEIVKHFSATKSGYEKI
ncbi:unnamed protein product [Bemisia tabaci]|uniref:Major facilitator superfamily (MFS) profile domain-containing protein n=1 Tax=Bemisia tabaci TaxID=7038 RepID=A0A9P0ABG5_BEMTA|nr:PREDICTED: facilitated trehalose transporter Tret1-like [Bemisia tabaci]CAH0389626.1 unnamed protein product [Bemisia tabaci]